MMHLHYTLTFRDEDEWPDEINPESLLDDVFYFFGQETEMLERDDIGPVNNDSLFREQLELTDREIFRVINRMEKKYRVQITAEVKKTINTMHELCFEIYRLVKLNTKI